jgi:hypothetical protein
MLRPKLFLVFVMSAVCAFVSPLHAQEQIPVGTVIPIVLDHALDSRSSKPGQRFVARVAQEVPLPDKRVIRVRSKIFGEVTDTENILGQAKLGLRFDRLELGKTQIAISTKLRALASWLDVNSAKTTYGGGDLNIPASATTAQVGGTIAVYRGGGAVENENGKVVGTPVYGGVLAVVTNKPGSQCESIPVTETPQAVWVFSPEACGVYGLRDIRFENGSDSKSGEIILVRKNKKDWKWTSINLSAGSAMLLAVSGTPGH